MIERRALCIDGGWRAPAGEETIRVHSPHDGHPVGVVPLAVDADADAALAAARASSRGEWGSATADDRAGFVRALSAALQARGAELAELITEEVVWSADTDRAVALASRLQVGTCAVNSGVIVEPRSPFADFKQSGIGREMGREGVEAYLETRSVVLPPG